MPAVDRHHLLAHLGLGRASLLIACRVLHGPHRKGSDTAHVRRASDLRSGRVA